MGWALIYTGRLGPVLGDETGETAGIRVVDSLGNPIAPTLPEHLTTKAYVDSQFAGGLTDTVTVITAVRGIVDYGSVADASDTVNVQYKTGSN